MTQAGPAQTPHDAGRLRRNLSWQTIANLGAAVLGALYLIWLGRALGAEKFGLYALATGVATFVFLITDFRLQEAMVRFMALFGAEPDKRSACTRLLFGVDVGARVVGCLALLALSGILAAWLARSADAAEIIAVAALAGFAGKIGNAPAIGVLRSVQRFDWHAGVLLATWAAKLVFTVILIELQGPDLVAILLVSLVCDLLGNLLLWLGAWRELRRLEPPAAHVSLSSLRESSPEIRRFLASAAGISASDSLVRELDTTLVAWFLPLSEVGIYRMAKNIIALVWRAVDPVYVVLMPEFASHLAGGRGAEAGALARKATRLVFLVALAGFIACALTLPFIVPWIIGPSFNGTVAAALVMLAGVVLGAPFIWTHAYSVAAGKLHVQLIANLLGASFAALLFLVLTPKFSTAGASIGYAAALAGPFLISAFFWRRSWLPPRTP